MKTLVDSNEHPKNTFHYRSIPKAEDFERIATEMSQIIQGDDWKETGKNHILQNYVRDIDRGIGIGFLWLYADENEKSKGSFLFWKEFIDIVHTMGVTKSYAYDCKRAAYVIKTIMDEPEIWQVFSKRYLHKTAIYRFSYMKPSLKKYLKSDKTDADKQKFFEVMERAHTLSRFQLRNDSKRREIHKFKGRIKETQGKELVVAIPGVSSLKERQNSVIGSPATVFVTINKKRQK